MARRRVFRPQASPAPASAAAIVVPAPSTARAPPRGVHALPLDLGPGLTARSFEAGRYAERAVSRDDSRAPGRTRTRGRSQAAVASQTLSAWPQR
jgi:hypothetical protein